MSRVLEAEGLSAWMGQYKSCATVDLVELSGADRSTRCTGGALSRRIGSLQAQNG